MNTISEILTNKYSDQGIQNMKVFYDSYVFNLKIKNGSEYNNTVLIEKFVFDYDAETIKRIKNSLIVNFGDTESSVPHTSNGNTFIDSFLDKSKKIVFLIGIKKMSNGNIIPIIYQYSISNHSVKSIFPAPEDIEQFNSISLDSDFINTKKPIARFLKNRILIAYETTDSYFNYLHRIIINTRTNKIASYNIFKYDPIHNMDFKSLTTSDLVFKKDGFYGFLSQVADDGLSDLEWSIFALDDSDSILIFDDGVTGLALDNF